MKMDRERIENIVFAALMPHAPVLVPPIGGKRAEEAGASISAMREVSRRIVEKSPEAVVLISPHAPRNRTAFGVWSGERVSGTFAQFGAPEIVVNLPSGGGLEDEIARQATRLGLETWDI